MYAQTREAWLTMAVEEIMQRMSNVGFADTSLDGTPLTDAVRVSLGFPRHKRSADKNCLGGECLDRSLSKDGMYEIFIPPTISSEHEALGCLLHQLMHVISRNGHEAIKLYSYELMTRQLGIVLSVLGPMPYAPVVTKDKTADTRLLLVGCSNVHCSSWTSRGPWQVRMTLGRIKQGKPNCPVCGTLCGVKDHPDL